jgi:outer membrane lipoprotein-sorting protein
MNRTPLLAGLAALALATGPATQAGQETDAIPPALIAWSDELGKIATLASDFRQEKRLALFQDSLHIQGRLYISTNGQFAWETHWPVRYKMVVSDGRLRQWDEETGRVQTRSLRDNPAFAVIQEQMTAWFSGRYASLTNSYAVTLTSARPVVFLFTPHTHSPAAGYLRSVEVRIRPDGQYLDTVRITERGGDLAEIAFTNTVLNQPLPAEAWDVRTLAAPAPGGQADPHPAP